MNLNELFRQSNAWFFNTAQRALDQAYNAASMVKAIEDQHFDGQKVSPYSTKHSSYTAGYFQSEVRSSLLTIKVRLAEFRISRSLLSIYNFENASADVAEKIKFIDAILSRYERRDDPSTITIKPNTTLKSKNSNKRQDDNSYSQAQIMNNYVGDTYEGDDSSMGDRTEVLPRSLLSTFNRIKKEIDPQSQVREEEVLKRFRRSRYKTAVSIKFILILLIVPLLVQQISKNFIFSPIIDKYLQNHEQIVFINADLEEEALGELKAYEESIHFKSLVGLSPKLTPEEIEIKIKEKADELTEEYRYKGADAIENIFADLCSFISIVLIFIFSRKELSIFRQFLDEITYQLSDSAKAFLLILFTDMLVGFHSPHGWEVLLESVSKHFGLPENADFNFLFIATFPVILDTAVKYWIFRYLNKISPSAVATYKDMNE